MRKLAFLLLLVCTSFVFISASDQKPKSLKETLTLQVPPGDGTNGVAVAYNSKKMLYYTAFAGNASFPLTIFNKKGELVNGTLTAGVDMRGLWYRPKEKILAGNAYAPAGYFTLDLDKNGYPAGAPFSYAGGESQPEENSVGAYAEKNDEIVFCSADKIYFYERGSLKQKRSLTLTGMPGEWDDLTSFSVIYTGESGKEIGLLNYKKGLIYFFNASNGVYSASVALPVDAPKPDRFCFSYANGIYWVFDKDSRKWHGYK